MKRVGSGKRINAGFIDFIIAFGAFFVVGVGLAQIGLDNEIVVLLLLFAAFSYTPLMCASKSQATLGMRLCKLKMTSADGGPVNVLQSYFRAVLEAVAFLITGGIGCAVYMFIMLDCTEKKLLLQDMIAKTCVVSTDPNYDPEDD